MFYIILFFVHIMAQSGCEPKYRNLYPKQQQIANLNIYDVIPGFNYTLQNPPNGTAILQSGNLLFGEAIKEDIQQVLFAHILETVDLYPMLEQIASLVQINSTSYQVLVLNYYYNQTYTSQLYSAFDSNYQCLTLIQINSSFMIINCLQNQMVTIYNGNTQISILPNITSTNYPSQIQVSSQNYNTYQLTVIYPNNSNTTYYFNMQILQNTVEYTYNGKRIWQGILYNIFFGDGHYYYLTSQEFQVINGTSEFSFLIQDCYYFSVIQTNWYIFLCKENIQEYHKKTLYKVYPYPFYINFLSSQKYLPLQSNSQYTILQNEQNYIIYDAILNEINFYSQTDQPVFILINPMYPTYYMLSTSNQQIFSIFRPLLVINQLEYQLSDTTFEINLYISLNNSCQVSLNIIPSINNNMIYEKNSSKQLPQKTTQSIPVQIEMSKYLIGSNISFTTQSSDNILNTHVFDLLFINDTNSNSAYNLIIDSNVIFIYTQSNDLKLYYLIYLQFRNYTQQTYSCKVQENPMIYFFCSLDSSSQLSEQIYSIATDNKYQQSHDFSANCVGFITKINCQIIGIFLNPIQQNYKLETPILQIEINGPFLYVMQENIITLFDLYNFNTDKSFYNITNITPTQIITNYELYDSVLLINNQTQLLIYYIQYSGGQLINSINISILNPTIILVKEYLQIGNSTMQETYYIYNLYTIKLINKEYGNYSGQYYFNQNLKYYLFFSSDNIVYILQNSGQNDQLFKSIQFNNSIEQGQITTLGDYISITFLCNKIVQTILIDQYQTVVITPQYQNIDYINSNYTINASNEFNFLIQTNQLLVLNSGVFISANQQDLQQLYLTAANQSFSLNSSIINGQITNYAFNCFQCENYNVTQQYQLFQTGCELVEPVSALTIMSNMKQIALLTQCQIYIFTPLNNTCEYFGTFTYNYECSYITYSSKLNIFLSYCYYNELYWYIVTNQSAQSVYYQLSHQLTNIQFVDQYNAILVQEQNNQTIIVLYQATDTDLIFEQSIITNSKIVSFTFGVINYNDSNYMVLMSLTQDQQLQINVFQVTFSQNLYNYSLLNTQSISITNLLEKYSFDGRDVNQIQIVQITGNSSNQYQLTMQTIITTNFFYSYSVNINILIGSPDQISSQLQCLISPYGNWNQQKYINGNKQTLILTYQQLIVLYDLNQCQNQSVLNFSIGIPIFSYSPMPMPIQLYSNQPDQDLFQSSLYVSDYQFSYYNFSKDFEIAIESANNMTKNQSVYLIAQNHFMQYNMTLYLIDDVPKPQPEPMPVSGPIIAWWAWLLISLGVVLIVSVTSLLLIKKKQQKREEPLLEMK